MVVLLIVVAVVMEVTVVDILPPVTHPSTRHPSIQTLPPALPHVVIFSLKVKVTLICLYSSYQYSRIPFLLFIFLFFLISSLIFSTLPSFFSFIPLGPSGLDVLPFFTLTSERYRHTLARLEHQLLDAASCHQDMNAIIQLKAVRTEVGGGDITDTSLLLSQSLSLLLFFVCSKRSILFLSYIVHTIINHPPLYILSYSRWCCLSSLRCSYP